MARIREYNVSFQEVQLFRRNVLNITESKTKRTPFFLPKMKLNETSTSDKGQQPNIELDVHGLGKTDHKRFTTSGKRKQKRKRKHKDKVNSFSSPSNMSTDYKSPAFSLPPINSKPLTHQRFKNAPSCSRTKTTTPQQEFDIAFNTLMSVVERSKQEQKRTTQRFQRNIVQGEHKPINEKLQPSEEAQTGSLPEWWLKLVKMSSRTSSWNGA